MEGNASFATKPPPGQGSAIEAHRVAWGHLEDNPWAKLKEIKEEMRQRRHHSGVVGQEICSIFEMWFLRPPE